MSSDIYPQVYSPICRSLVHSLLVDFGVVLLLVVVVVVVIGVKQSQLLVQDLDWSLTKFESNLKTICRQFDKNLPGVSRQFTENLLTIC